MTSPIPSRQSARRAAVAVVAGLLASACISPRTPVQVEDLLSQALRAAETHHEFDMDPEAAVLVDAVYDIDRDYPGLRELDEDLEDGARVGVERTPLGANRGFRPQVGRSTRTRVLLWLPDRVLDLLDVVTVGVHFGLGAFADAHATRAIQAVAGFHATGGLGIHDHRSIGIRSQAEAGLTIIAAGAHTYGGTLMGTTGTHSASMSSSGIHLPSDPLYEGLRDYWAFGATATAGIVGAEAEFHPLQLADFLAGFVGVDFLNDDLAHTRSLKLDPIETKLLGEIRRVSRSEAEVVAYLEAKRLGQLTAGRPWEPAPGDGTPEAPAERIAPPTPAAPSRTE